MRQRGKSDAQESKNGSAASNDGSGYTASTAALRAPLKQHMKHTAGRVLGTTTYSTDTTIHKEERRCKRKETHELRKKKDGPKQEAARCEISCFLFRFRLPFFRSTNHTKIPRSAECQVPRCAKDCQGLQKGKGSAQMHLVAPRS
jgi:hypothetical protein